MPPSKKPAALQRGNPALKSGALTAVKPGEAAGRPKSSRSGSALKLTVKKCCVKTDKPGGAAKGPKASRSGESKRTSSSSAAALAKKKSSTKDLPTEVLG